MNEAVVIDVTVGQGKPMTRKRVYCSDGFHLGRPEFSVVAHRLDYQHFKLYPKKKSYPVVTGQVIDRHNTEYHMGFRRPLMMIRPDGSNVTVRALLIRNQLFDFPNGISFHYSGDPREEVLLVGESDPRAVTLFMVVLPVVLPAFLLGLFFYGRRKKKISMER